MYFSKSQLNYLIEISKKSKLAHTSVKKHLEALNKEGIIKETKEKRTFPIYGADLESKEYRYYKKLSNPEKIKTLTDYYGIFKKKKIKFKQDLERFKKI